MDLLVPPEITECTTLKIKQNGEILDYTDEESPRYKEVFLKYVNGQLVDRSNQVVAFFDEEKSPTTTIQAPTTIQATRVSGGTTSLNVATTTLQCSLGTFEIVQSAVCCGCGGVGGGGDYSSTFDVLLQHQRIAQFTESPRTQKSLQVEFFGKDASAKWISLLFVVYRVQERWLL
jgi:hypothetical protein